MTFVNLIIINSNFGLQKFDEILITRQAHFFAYHYTKKLLYKSDFLITGHTAFAQLGNSQWVLKGGLKLLTTIIIIAPKIFLKNIFPKQ